MKDDTIIVLTTNIQDTYVINIGVHPPNNLICTPVP